MSIKVFPTEVKLQGEFLQRTSIMATPAMRQKWHPHQTFITISSLVKVAMPFEIDTKLKINIDELVYEYKKSILDAFKKYDEKIDLISEQKSLDAPKYHEEF